MYKKGYRHGHRDYSDDDLLHSDESLDEEMKANMPTVEELLVKLEYAGDELELEELENILNICFLFMI